MCQVHEIINRCVQAFNNGYGYACSESVLLGFKDYCGLDDSIVPRIATPFGGGVAGNGFICGALQASFIVLGMKFGRTRSDEDRTLLYQKVNAMIAKFTNQYGTINCGEIRRLPAFLKDPVKIKSIKNGYHENVCNQLVQNVATWLLEDL